MPLLTSGQARVKTRRNYQFPPGRPGKYPPGPQEEVASFPTPGDTRRRSGTRAETSGTPRVPFEFLRNHRRADLRNGYTHPEKEPFVPPGVFRFSRPIDVPGDELKDILNDGVEIMKQAPQSSEGKAVRFLRGVIDDFLPGLIDHSLQGMQEALDFPKERKYRFPLPHKAEPHSSGWLL